MKKILLLFMTLFFIQNCFAQKYTIRDTLNVEVTKILADSLANDTTITSHKGHLSIKDSSITVSKINQVFLESQTASVDSDSVHVDISSYSFTNPQVILTNRSNWHASVKSVSASEVVLYIDIAGYGTEVKYDLLIIER